MNSDEYLNYFQFLKNLKNTPDTGSSPLAEWHHVVRFFVGVYTYLEVEWNINLDNLLDFAGCKVDDYSVIHRHKQCLADIIVSEFRRNNNVSNAASMVIDYLRDNSLIKAEEE